MGKITIKLLDDIQDGIRAKLFSLEELIEIDFFKQIFKSHKKNIKGNKEEILIYQIIRDSIDLMVKDLIKNTIKNIKFYKIKNLDDLFSILHFHRFIEQVIFGLNSVLFILKR